MSFPFIFFFTLHLSIFKKKKLIQLISDHLRSILYEQKVFQTETKWAYKVNELHKIYIVMDPDPDFRKSVRVRLF